MSRNKSVVSTPIVDFVKQYAESGTVRLHMPGHKGTSFLGCEPWDITEIGGADSLYEADGIIAESEENATKLFGSQRTLLSTEGSSQCIRAMLYLCILAKQSEGQRKKPRIAASRNVHKAFIYAAALLDFEVIWLWPEKQQKSICSCYISKEQVESVLKEHQDISAVYLTSPDYLGGQLDIGSIAETCHKHQVFLAVDNAHGAYLKFLEPSQHPLDLGADICCDSAHKTLPVLTGGAYLHISKNAPELFVQQAKYAMNLFGSTSPSYLIMASLDLANEYLAKGYCHRLEQTIEMRNRYVMQLKNMGWKTVESDPLKITLEIPENLLKEELLEKLAEYGVECEYADPNYMVFMITPENEEEHLQQLVTVFGIFQPVYLQDEIAMPEHHGGKAKAVMSIRDAMFSMPECIPVTEAESRICRVPTVSCPPAIPIAVPGELITKELICLFEYYGVKTVDVVKSHFSESN